MKNTWKTDIGDGHDLDVVRRAGQIKDLPARLAKAHQADPKLRLCAQDISPEKTARAPGSKAVSLALRQDCVKGTRGADPTGVRRRKYKPYTEDKS
jgi:hypothetical protein